MHSELGSTRGHTKRGRDQVGRDGHLPRWRSSPQHLQMCPEEGGGVARLEAQPFDGRTFACRSSVTPG
eukprot:12136316-Alexandrium_andersonii.AAC.1